MRLKGSVVALGTFDGVHHGHQKLIKAALRHARKQRSDLTVITFDPHPQLVVSPRRGLELLTTLSERKELIESLGADKLVVIRFDKSLRRMKNEAFIQKYLIRRIKAACVFVGYDHAFGYERRGGPRDLKKHGFKVMVIPPVSKKGRHIKSSQIRKELARGNFNLAVKELGHPYQISGRVVKGKGRGKDLGFPTANIQVPKHKLLPSYGVYIGRANGKKCVVNIGSRPTFGASNVVVEAHLLNFKGNLKGKRLKLYLFKKIRDELHFADVELLKKQIRKDIGIARGYVV